MPRFGMRSETSSPEFSVLRLSAGYVLLAILVLWVAPCHAGPVPTTTTAVSVSPSGSVAQGTVLTLQATVSSGGSPVSKGSVTFYDGAIALATVQLVGTESTYTLGTANLKLRLGPGSHSIKAVYGGVLAFAGSTSSAQAVTVTSAGAAVTTTAIDSSGSAGNYTLQGTVTALSSTAPTGNISFVDQSNNNFSLGTAPLDVATLTSGFGALAATASGYGPFGVVIGDVNGDGIPDLVIADYLGSAVSVLIGNGDGTYVAHVDYSLGSSPAFGLTLGDVNGDGYLDIVVAVHNGSGIDVLLGNGDGTFQAAQATATTGSTNYVALADLNRDGNLDIVTMDYYANTVVVFLGNGDGTFQTAQSFAAGSNPYGLTVGDFNNDGKVDVAVSNYGDNTISVLLGSGDGTLQGQITYTVGTGPTNLLAVDLDGDGKQDLVVSNYSGSTVSVLLGNGDGTFKTNVDYVVSDPWGLAAADINGDGIPDVVIGSPASEITLLQGKGDGTFKTPVLTPTGGSTYMVALADLNGDGVIDLAVTSLSGNTVSVGLSAISETATLAGVSIPGGGSHNVVAKYAGDAHSALSASDPISLGGSTVTTALSLTVAPNPATSGQAVALTATIAPATRAGYTSSGTVTFYDAGVAIGSAVTVSNGQAVLTKSDLVTGDHSITAAYSGDTNFAGSTASAVTMTVGVPDYSISASPTTLTIHRGQTGTSTLTVTPVGGYTGPIAFTCSGLPEFATCSFTPASLQLDGSNTSETVQFKLNTAATALVVTPRFGAGPGRMLALVTPFLALSLLSITTRRRNSTRFGRSRWLHMLIIAIFFLGVAGCSSGSNSDSGGPKVPLGTSTVTATATGTAVGGSTTRSATIGITIVQ